MDDAVRYVTQPFSEWAARVTACSSLVISELYEEDVSSHPFASKDCTESYCRLLRTLDSHCVGEGEECRKKLVTARVYTKLGKAVVADWEGISARLAQRVGTQAQDPAWLQGDPQKPADSVSERLRRACCANEVAIFMLRLAVRSACHASSWYGPLECRKALQQLVSASAWTSLACALRALLTALEPNLANQYNALNIVSDILHVSQQHSCCSSPDLAYITVCTKPLPSL